MYPESVVPAGSRVRDELNAVHTMLIPLSEAKSRTGDRAAQLRFPRSLLPAFLGCKVFVKDPVQPRFESFRGFPFAGVPLGVGVGKASPLGATVRPGQGDLLLDGSEEGTASVNFAVTSRHASAPRRPPQALLCADGDAPEQACRSHS